ncbi:MAG: TonB-dependent receptor [Hydrogenophilaceae bacterium]|jgi:iron complex outermembrane receptor protein|nr:TonB-dependent receptor [Hydrogenophilaceae bacterium]
MNIHALWLSASVLTLGWTGAALAQTSDEPEGAASEEIVVTAERRSTSLQTTGISASVLTGEDLADRGVTYVDQLQFITPAATVNNFGQGIDFNIRGIGKAEHNTQTTTGVITYRDGVATFPGYFTAEPYYDIARVEILRGPQGTFVGQNATGGAVFVTSNSPVINGGHHGYIAGQLGNYSNVALQGAINLPISDTLAARVAFNGDMRDSFYDITGPYTGDDGVRMASARFGLLWEPTDALSVLWKTDLNYLDLSAYPSDPVNSTNSLFEITQNADLVALDRGVRSVLEVNYQFGGGITLRSVSGYQEANTAYKADLDGTSVGNRTFRDSVDEVIWSQEFNLISPDAQPFSWVLGGMWQYDKYTFRPGEFVIGLPEGNPLTEYVLDGTNPKNSWAVFGQAGYDLAPGLELTVGARYSYSDTTNNIFVMQYGLPLTQNQSAEFSNLSGKVALNWEVNDDNFLYGFVATGFRPGGLNVPVGLGPPAPFAEEEVTSYEVGWKAIWFDGRLHTQTNAFYNEYDGFQVIIGYPTIPVFGFELNNPNTTTMYGFEFQAQATLGDLSVDVGLGLLKSELGEFFATDPRVPATTPCDPETGPSSASCINLVGREQTYAPEFTFNLAAQYVFRLDGGDRLTPRINYGHVSEQWATLFQNVARGDNIEARNVVNGQLAWTHGDLVVTLYGTNLTDQEYVGAINSGLRFAGPPRQYGIRLMRVF